MNITQIALRNNRTTFVLYAILMLVGFSTYFNIGRLEYPDFTIRNARITTQYPGRSALEVEQQVTNTIEDSIRQMAEVNNIRSTSKPGLSIVTVELKEEYFDLEPIWQDMRNLVAATPLPAGAQTPQINDDIGDVYPYVYALQGEDFTAAELADYAETLQDELLTVDGVAKVELHGKQDERIYLEFSSSQLAALGTSPMQIIEVLKSQNVVANSGTAKSGIQRLNIVTLGEFASLQELADYRLQIPASTTQVRIADIFDVKRDYVDPPRAFSHFNGKRAVCIAISMTKGSAVTKVGERIEAKRKDLQQQLPIGLEISRMFFQPQYVDASIRSFVVNLGQAFFFVVIVMFLFAGVRLALIVGILVPSATLMTFAFMPVMGVQLEMMSIAALIIALGLLVDNAVVVSEQILVRLGRGEDRLAAVTTAGKELLLPLLAASATTIAAFSPIALAKGGASEFTYSLFAVVSMTLLSSWLLSLTIIPMCCYYFLKPMKKDTLVGKQLTKLYRPYEYILRLTLRLKWAYPILIACLTLLAAFAFKYVPNIFFPPNERGQFIVDFELPLGTDIATTEEEVTRFENWLISQDNIVKNVSSWIGNGGPRWYLSLSPEPANPNYALLSILTKTEDAVEIRSFMEQVKAYAVSHLPSARISPKTLETGPVVGDPIQIRLYGRDMNTLYAIRNEIVATISNLDGLHDVRDSWGAWVKQMDVNPNPIAASRLGLTTESLAYSINSQYTGIPVTDFREGDKSIAVIVRAKDDFREHPERLADVPIFASNDVVTLGQVTDIAITFQPGSILRENSLRMMTIKAKVNGRFASTALAEIRPLLAELAQHWPTGYHIEYGGEEEESGKAQGNIGAAMPISIAMLAMILIAQFNSIRRFAIIMVTIPPMLIGVTPGLLVTGSSFGFMTLLGLIALLGIIVNNAILLIDEINHQLSKHDTLADAIIESCKSRLRPIILTTCTTIVGLLPLAIGGGGMWSSMAYAMMFGLGFATALTLLLCPALFCLLFSHKPSVS